MTTATALTAPKAPVFAQLTVAATPARDQGSAGPQGEISAARQDLDAAFQIIATVKSSIESAQRAHLRDRTNGVQRFFLRHGDHVISAGMLGLIASCIAAPVSGSYMSSGGCFALVAGMVAASIATCAAPWLAKRPVERRLGEPLVKNDVQALCSVLTAFSSRERALVAPNVAKWQSVTIYSGGITPEASAAVTAATSSEASQHARERLAGRAAQLIITMREQPTRWEALREELRALLAEASDRGDLAAAIASKVFDGEHCNLTLPPTAQHELFNILRASESASKPEG